ncbi:unnamed protein product [Merluccius merluccius]
MAPSVERTHGSSASRWVRFSSRLRPTAWPLSAALKDRLRLISFTFRLFPITCGGGGALGWFRPPAPHSAGGTQGCCEAELGIPAPSDAMFAFIISAPLSLVTAQPSAVAGGQRYTELTEVAVVAIEGFWVSYDGFTT